VSESRTPPLTYRQAGVDIDAGEALVEAIKPLVARTTRPGMLGTIGGFGGCFALEPGRYQEPVLVASTDGVGTKIKLAAQLNRYDTIGIDLVAMCANDIIVQGAEPLFFLDYYATGKLDTVIGARIVEGIAEGCCLAGMALIGGETAEMPGVYAPADYDLAGFAVGIVERTKLLDGSAVKAGDALVGLASSGPHANGYSLIRNILDSHNISLDTVFADTALGEVLLTPTRIYVRAVLQLLAAHAVHALAHITGGGLVGNLPRVLPEGLCAMITSGSWPRPPIFDWLQKQGDIADAEMYRTFNCGVGMVLVVNADGADAVMHSLRQQGETPFLIGEVNEQTTPAQVIIR
jgi:phosphoribosylformylglycinamidine cyclo-ligase